MLTGSGISYFGDWLSTVAVMLTLYRLTGATGPALYMAARVLPRPLGAWCGGLGSQRLGPRRWLLVSTTAQMVCTVAMAGAIATAHTGLLIASVVAAQLLGVAAIPARTHLIAHITGDTQRTRAMGRNSMLASLAMVCAPPAGALLLLVVPAQTVVAIDAATFCAALVFFLTCHLHVAAAGKTTATSGGFRLLIRSRALRRLAIAAAGNFAVVTVLQAQLVSIAHDHLGGTAVVGLLYGAVGAGAISGGLLASHRRPRAMLVPLIVAECACAVMAAAVTSAAAAVVLLALCGAAGAAYQVGGSLLLIDEAGRERAGSASGALTSVCYAGMAGGALFATLAAALGPSLVAITGAVALSLALAASLAEAAAGFVRGSKKDLPMRFGNDATAVQSTLVQDHP